MEGRILQDISIFVLSENGESIVTSSSTVSPKGTSFRLPKRKDKNGLYVKYRNRKVYEPKWIRHYQASNENDGAGVSVK